MSNYPNYRIAVEIVIMHKGQVLLAKRSENANIAPGVWNVPAGKVKYEEVPLEALYREAKEETNLEVELIKELSVRNLTSISANGEPIYRVVFTYLVKPEKEDISALHINEEHSEYVWVDKQELQSGTYDSLLDELKKPILEQVLN